MTVMSKRNIWKVETLDCFGKWVTWVEGVTLEEAQGNMTELQHLGCKSRIVENR